MDPDSSQLSNFEEKVKNDNIISSSSDEENNIEKENKEFKSRKETKTSKKDEILNYQETNELYQKNTKIPRTKKIQLTILNTKSTIISTQIKNINRVQMCFSHDLFCELFNEKDPKKNLNMRR